MRTAKQIKVYIFTDKTGRGVTNEFNRTEAQGAFKGERNWDGEVFSKWANTASAGDTWENAAARVTIISRWVTR